MLGIPTLFRIHELTIERLASSPDADLRAIAAAMRNYPEYSYLGAIGPTLADFIPSPPRPEEWQTPSNWLVVIWKAIFEIVGGDGTPANPGLQKIYLGLQNLLQRLDAIADAEDLMALDAENNSGSTGDLALLADALRRLVTRVSSPNGLAVGIAGAIGNGMRPAVNVNVGSATPDPVTWGARDFLFWKKPGKFVEALLARAKQSGDDRFLSYAYGYVTSYAANVCGSPFVNSIVRGTYRTDWWRTRWINTHIDAWVHGYYGASAAMAGDVPNPPYDAWPNLCDAKLQVKIMLNGIDPIDIMKRLRKYDQFPQVLPREFCVFWFDAFKDAYGPTQPGCRFSAETVNGAYIMTWMALWFQTSGEIIGCNPAPPLSPPSGCGDTPSWTDPTVPGDNGTGSVPPEPTIESDPDVGKIVTGIILALLGVVSLGAGGLVAGGIAIGAGINDILKGANDKNWGKLRCDLHWYRLYLYNSLKAVHEMLSLAALRYPYASDLMNDEETLKLLGNTLKFDSGKRNVKSLSLLEQFPSKPWDGGLGTWIQVPNRGFEEPQTVAYQSQAYPCFFIDDDNANPIGSGEVRVGGSWPPGYRVAQGSSLPVQFGNAVANCVDVFRSLGGLVPPDWNLDGDRGLAYLTWQFRHGVYTDPVDIEAET